MGATNGGDGLMCHVRHGRTLVALLCLIVGQAHAESIDRVVLPSGLTVVIAEQHTTQAVEVRIAVRAGPVYDVSAWAAA